jgi:hypothetical protein
MAMAQPPDTKVFSKSCPPYLVTFRQLRRMDNIFSFQTLVACDDRTITLSTDWRAEDLQDAVKTLGRLTGVKDGYLFTPRSCAGGNAWRCETEYVISRDRGPKVLGAVGRHEDWKKPGMSLKDGLFLDGFDGLEINPFTCHAAAPSFEVLLVLKGDRFTVAKDATWRMNAEQYSQYQGTMTDMVDVGTITANYLGGLALTRLCGKKAEWDRIVKAGKTVLGSKAGEHMADYVAKKVSKYRLGRIPE